MKPTSLEVGIRSKPYGHPGTARTERSGRPGPWASSLVFGLLVMVGLGRALAVAGEPPAEPVVVEVASEEERLSLAVQRMMGGDFDGAEIVLDRLAGASGPTAEEVRYHRAQLARLRGRTDEARAALTTIAGGGGHRAMDAHFLLADLEANAGNPELALAALRTVAREGALRGSDRKRWKLSFVTFEGDLLDPSRAERGLRRALRRGPFTDLSWYEARAWARLARARVGVAFTTSFQVSEGRLPGLIRRRQGWILSAEQAVNQAIALNEPEWVLEGILALADGYEAYGDAMRDAPFPTYLPPAEQQRYADGVAEQVEASWLRAITYLDRAHDMAARLRWDSARAAAVAERSLELQRRVQAGEARPALPVVTPGG